jgi:hypothetical protein
MNHLTIHQTTADLIDWVQPLRLEGESVFDAFERLMLFGALAATDTQKEAAALLGVSERVISYKCATYGVRKRDIEETSHEASTK